MSSSKNNIMRTKTFFLFSLLVGLTGIIQAQKNMHKVFGTDDKIIKGSSKVYIYAIESTPIMSVDQMQGENYVYDYRIIKTIVATKKMAGALTLAVLDTNEYFYGLNKKCPFMGKYAVQYRTGQKTITLTISSEPCEKLIIFCPGSVIDKRHIDIRIKSRIITAIETLMNPTVKVEDKSKTN